MSEKGVHSAQNRKAGKSGRPKGTAFVKGQGRKADVNKGPTLTPGNPITKAWCYICGAAHARDAAHSGRRRQAPGQYAVKHDEK